MQYLLPHLFGQILERSIQVESVMGGKTGQHGMRERVAAVPAADGAAGQAPFPEGHYSSVTEKNPIAPGVTGRAPAHPVVEAEQPGFPPGPPPLPDPKDAGWGKGGARPMTAR